MVAHEYAHGYAALKQGDTTAYSLGRLTWNPIPHIDPFYTIIMPLLAFVVSHGNMVFGGAKPVPVIPRNYRDYKRGDIIVSLAGVATNLLIALACVPLMIVVGLIGSGVPAFASTGALVQAMLRFAWALNYQRLGAQGLLILIVLLTFGRPLLDLWFAPVFFLETVASRVVMPYLIPSQWTM